MASPSGFCGVGERDRFRRMGEQAGVLRFELLAVLSSRARGLRNLVESSSWLLCWLLCWLLLSLHSFRSLTLSHLRRRKRFRRGEALGVEQLDQGVSSSLEGVISIDGSCRNSLPGAKTPGRSWASPASRLCSCTFLMRRILKRRRRSVGVDELDQTGLPSGAPCGSGTCRAGSWRFSIMLAAGMGPRRLCASSAPSASRLAPARRVLLPTPGPRRARPSHVGKRSGLELQEEQAPLPERSEEGARGHAARRGARPPAG